jgi:uncharacterized membrane protein YjjP (DUF1212 family)
MSQLTNTVIKIRHYVETNTLPQHENDEDVKYIINTQPKLYAMVQKKDCDLGILYRLISLQEEIHKGKLESEEADKQFGEIAAKRYVYPLVNEKT